MRGGVPLSARLVGVAAAALAGTGTADVLSGIEPSGRSMGRIYGYSAIKRHLQQQKRDARGGQGSLAGRPHDHEREISRRLRQAVQVKANRHARALAKGAARNLKLTVGLSRRGRRIVSE